MDHSGSCVCPNLILNLWSKIGVGRVSNHRDTFYRQKTVATVLRSWPSVAILDAWLSVSHTDEPFTEILVVPISGFWYIQVISHQTKIHSALWKFHLEMQPVDTSFLNIHGLPWQTLLVYLSWGFSRFCFYTYSVIPFRIRLSPSQAFRFSYPTFLQPCITKVQDLVRFYHRVLKGMTCVYLQ